MWTYKFTEQRWETEEYEPDYVHHWNLESRHLWKGTEFYLPVLFVCCVKSADGSPSRTRSGMTATAGTE